MKKIILFTGIFLLTVNLLGQTGTGWAQQRAKMNFKDSTNFVKATTFDNTIIMNGATTGATTLRPFVTASGTLIYPSSASIDTLATKAYARSVSGGGVPGTSFAYIDSANYYTNTLNVLDYGAVSDDSQNDADNIRAAITAAVAGSVQNDPDGRPIPLAVYIPAGSWYITDSIVLVSHLNLIIDKNAYFEVPNGNYTPIF